MLISQFRYSGIYPSIIYTQISDVSVVADVVACRLKKVPIVAETPAHKQGHNLLMKTEQRRRSMKLGPADAVVAESPLKFSGESTATNSLPQLARRASFYSELPSRSVSKYSKLEDRMTHKVSSPPSRKFDGTYVAGSWLTSPRRITPKALFASLLSPSPSRGAVLPRKLELQCPVRTAGNNSAAAQFKSPAKTALGSAAPGSPLRPMGSDVSRLVLDSPSRNTRSHVVSAQPGEISAPPGGGRYGEALPPSRGPVVWTRLAVEDQSQVDQSSACSAGQRLKVCDAAVRIQAKSRDRVSGLTPASAAEGDVEAAQPYSEDFGSAEVKNSAGQIPRFREKVPDEALADSIGWSPAKERRFSVADSLAFSSARRSFSKSSRLPKQPADKQKHVSGGSALCGSASIAGKPQTAETGVARKRKKSDDDHSGRSSARKTSNGQPCLDSRLLAAGSGVDDNEELAGCTVLSFGCDMDPELCADKMHSDILRHLGSSGVESESSSNDADLSIPRKYLLGRKCSSGFQSLGHISETECCPSPVFPSLSSGTAVDDVQGDTKIANNEHSAYDAVSSSPVFGQRRSSQFCAGESPCVPLSGSGCKRTPVVPGRVESFSPDVSEHSIAHLMTSPLLDGSEATSRTTRSRTSTRRCLEQQMYQAGGRSAVGRHISSKLRGSDS